MRDMKTYDVAVVGAGHNGLACAALLAKRGFSAIVIERAEQIGGAAVSRRDLWPGYTISAASYVCSLLDPWLVKELDLRAHGYEAYRKDPASFTPLADGRSLLLGREDAANAREIGAFDKSDVGGFFAFERRAGQLGLALFETFSDENPRFAGFASDVQSDLRESAAALVERYVQTPVLQATLATDGLIGTNLGPRDAGTGYVLAHHYAGRALGVQGAWGFVRGGMGAISTALASVAQKYGAEIVTDKRVTRIELRDGVARALVLDDGTEIVARALASNAHPQTTFLDLVGRDALDAAFVKKLDGWKTNGASLKLNLALGELPNFTARPGTAPQPHHRATIHVAPSIDYLQQSYEDGRTNGESDEPMLECFMQTPTDPSLAPPGKHILSIFAQYFPFDRADGWSAATREAAADKIVALLARYAPNLPGAIEDRQLLAAPDLEDCFGLVGGNIFHGELLPGQIYEERFATRTPVPGLYLCGSGAHPGGCVSGFPGKRAATAIAADLLAPA
jgi:phytoene dehydrogenase-like protein